MHTTINKDTGHNIFFSSFFVLKWHSFIMLSSFQEYVIGYIVIKGNFYEEITRNSVLPD